MAGKDEELSSLVQPSSKSMGSEATGVCGLKRKAEVTEEAAAVDVVLVDRSASQQVVLARQESEDDEDDDYSDEGEYDTDEDPEVSFAKVKARFEARVLEREARYPGLTYKDYSVEDEEDSHDDDDKPV